LGSCEGRTYDTVCCCKVATTLTEIQMEIFTTWRCQAICHLTGAQCVWSEGTPGRARRKPDKIQLLL